MNTQPIDVALLRAACDRSAANYDSTDFFFAETRERLLERLSLITLEADAVLDLGAGTGGAAEALLARFPDALVAELDWSEAMLSANPSRNTERICADAHRLPLAEASVDIVFSNMLLPFCVEPARVFAEARRVLRVPGLLLFNTLGPDTLREVRAAWRQADTAAHVHEFADMHNVGDALVEAGFREPVMDTERLTVTYRSVSKIVEDLRAVGATNLHAARRRGLTSPRRWDTMVAALESGRTADGTLPLSFELVTGQAWTAPEGPGVGMEEGVARFPLSRLR